ncbi:MAG: zf-HC2 domain-containing protein [Deltaproteobacteria bacterium]|nr:zf-HC2 domain-containing protein [Deltaproteobacteria bacterium]
MTCEEVQKFVYIYLDGEMEDAERREMMAHISACAACTRTIETERAVLKTVRARAAQEKAPEWFRGRVESALRTPPTVLPFVRGGWGVPLAAVAAAAALLIVLGLQHGGSLLKNQPADGVSPGVAKVSPRGVETAAFARLRPNLRAAGLFQYTDRPAVRPHVRRPVFTASDSPRLRHVDPYVRPGNGKRIYLVHGGSLNRPQLPGGAAYPAGATYAISGGAVPFDLVQAGYYDDEE